MSDAATRCSIQILTAAGLAPAPYRAASLADAARHEPRDGVYTVSNTDQRRRVLRLRAHLDRLEQSAAAAGIPLRLERARLRAALRQMMDEGGYAAARFRVTAPRQPADTLLLTMEEFTPPAPAVRAGGVRVATRRGGRQDAHIKDTAWMHERSEIQAAQAADIYEVILIDDDGRLLEGLGSNFYAIAGGQLWAAVAGVLSGIAQGIALAVAPAILPLRQEGFPWPRFAEMEEAFLTSSSRGIIPIIAMDGRPVGDGRPGALTLALQAAYDARAEQLMEAL